MGLGSTAEFIADRRRLAQRIARGSWQTSVKSVEKSVGLFLKFVYRTRVVFDRRMPESFVVHVDV